MNNSEKLNRNKIKPLAFLLNKANEKDIIGKPKCCYLLGAGCSKLSGIPLGREVIDICRILSFNQNECTCDKLVGLLNGKLTSHITECNKCITKTKKKEYQKYVKDTEIKFKDDIKAEIGNSNEKLLSKLPDNIKCNFKDKISKENKIKFIEYIFEDSKYGKWFEEYSGLIKERQELIERIIDEYEAKGDLIYFAKFMEQGFINNVFTTNFDDLLNDALRTYTNAKARVYAHNDLFTQLFIWSNKPNIIKLHGDYLFQDIKNTELETKELGSDIYIKFKEALNNMNLIVTGYNGADNSIMRALEDIKHKQQVGFHLLWCGKDASKLHWRVINLINSTNNSYFIKIDSFEELVSQLWYKFNKPLFTLEEDYKKKKEKLETFQKNFEKTIKDTNIKKDFNKNIEVSDYYAKSMQAFRESKYDNAIKYLSRAIELSPDNPYSYGNRGTSYFKLKKYDEAIKDYNKSISIKPDDASLYLSVAEIYIIKNDFESSLEILDKCQQYIKENEDKIIYYYLLIITKIMLNHNYTNLKNQFRNILKKEVITGWDFKDFDEWIEKNKSSNLENMKLIQEFNDEFRKLIITD